MKGLLFLNGEVKGTSLKADWFPLADQGRRKLPVSHWARLCPLPGSSHPSWRPMIWRDSPTASEGGRALPHRTTSAEWAQSWWPPANQGSKTPPHREQCLRDSVRSQESWGTRDTTALWNWWKTIGSRSAWVIFFLCSRSQVWGEFSLISKCPLVLNMGHGTLTRRTEVDETSPKNPMGFLPI